jgi:hypothetical protein
MTEGAPAAAVQGGGDGRVAWILALCAAAVAFWQLMAALSAREHSAFRLSAQDFEQVAFHAPGWSVRRLPVSVDPIEPNILAMEWRALSPAQPMEDRPVFVRLVHGYNMCDCMRIKHYTVELLVDTRPSAEGGHAVRVDFPPNVQVWAVTSQAGNRTIWITSMLRATDFTPTDVDVRDMAFPRVGTPDAQGWEARGLTLSSLRHPVRNLRIFLRAKWNASRCDVLTFLRLRQPAWASDELLTLVSASRGSHIPEAETADAIRHVVAAHMAAGAALRQSPAARRTQGPGG